MDYTYGAFFSYKRHPLTDRWHRELLARLQMWISQELARPSLRVFFDAQSIDNGHDFGLTIADALQSSAVLICLFSPLYFTSGNCLSEINAFFAREEMLGLRRGQLIACARFHDGDRYPDPYRRLQSRDFTDFANLSPRFWESEKGAEFESTIPQFAEQIASKIRTAPNRRPDFPASFFEGDPSSFAQPIMRPREYLERAS
jgi:hypothetical protein